MPLPLSERARATLQHSRDEAARLGHDVVGTEHLMLGLLREGGLPVRLLRGFGVDVPQLRHAIEATLPAAAALDPTHADLALSAEAEEVLTSAERTATEHGVDRVGAEWLLLGVLGDERGAAARILADGYGVTADAVRTEVLRLHGIEPTPPEPTVRELQPPYLLDRAASAEHRLSLVFDEDATEQEVAEVLVLLSELYRALGGDGLVILDSGIPAWDAEGAADD